MYANPHQKNQMLKIAFTLNRYLLEWFLLDTVTLFKSPSLAREKDFREKKTKPKLMHLLHML